jgi:O-succinylbenzoic acid--CoA ligase
MENIILVDHTKVHNKFKLNGYHLDRDDLCRVAYSFIKEGMDYEKPVGDFILDWFDEKETMQLQTSGSTGSPKNMTVNKQAMVNSALATGDFFDLKPGDTVLNCLPVRFIAGKMMFIRAFVLGLEMDFVAPSSTPLLRCQTTYDFCAMVPLQAQHSLAQLHYIKKLIVGGAPISKELQLELLSVPTEVFETYGMTETITHIAIRKLDETYFKVLPHVSITQDDRSCLVIEASSIVAQPIVTNDIVALESENTFKWLGRIDHVINSGGIKFIPEVLEGKLNLKTDRRFFISSIPDEALGEKIILVIEGEPFTVDPNAYAKLDKFEKPKEVHFVAHFEETHNGKTIRDKTLANIDL